MPGPRRPILVPLILVATTACAGSSAWTVSGSQQARRQAERVASGSGDPNALVGEGKPALFQAVEARDCQSAETLLEHGADPAATWQGWTPLQAAALVGEGSCAEVLLRHGADPNQRVRGAPALFLAAQRGDADTIRALIAAGARVDVAYSREFPIQVAAENGDADAVQALLDGGADANTRGPWGGNPMHAAAAAGNDDAAAVLLDADARLTEIPWDPWTTARTFDWAARYRLQQGDAARAEELRDIACEYYPLAVASLERDGDDKESELEEAEEATRECVERAGAGEILLPPWSPRPNPL